MKKFVVLFGVLLAVLAAAVGWQPAMPSNYVPPLDGQVVSIATGTVINGVRAAIADKAGTMILNYGDQYLFIWQYSGVGSGFWGINMATSKSIDLLNIFRTTGNLANTKTVSDLIQGLKDAGWTAVTGASVPPLLTSFIFAGKVMTAADGMLGMFMVVPVNQQGLFLDWLARYDVQG